MVVCCSVCLLTIPNNYFRPHVRLQSVGSHSLSLELEHAAELRGRAMLDLMYNETTGRFHDIDLTTNEQVHSERVVVCCVVLWCVCLDTVACLSGAHCPFLFLFLFAHRSPPPQLRHRTFRCGLMSLQVRSVHSWTAHCALQMKLHSAAVFLNAAVHAGIHACCCSHLLLFSSRARLLL